MNGRMSKILRRKALEIAENQFNKTSSTKISRFDVRWERYSPIYIYRRLKKAHTRRLKPTF